MQNAKQRRLLSGGVVVNVDQGTSGRADVLIAHGRIEAVAAPDTLPPEGCEVLDMSERLLIPGLINVHTHGHGFFNKGLGDRWPLELLLAAGAWMSSGRTTEDKELVGLLGAAELAAKGTTTCYDLFLELPLPTRDGMGALASAYSKVGIRAVIAPMVSDITLFDALPGLAHGLPPEIRAAVEGFRTAGYGAALEACREILKDWSSTADDIQVALAPAIPLHCSDAFLIELDRLAREFHLGIHTHLAESSLQVSAARLRYGASLVEHLEKLRLLDRRFTVAHAVWLSEGDLTMLADRGVSVAHNAGSNLRLGAGIARARDMLDRGIAVGIGTDTCSCSDHLNMFEAIRCACSVSRVRERDHGRWLTAREALFAGTVGGARVLGRDHELGRIAPGYLADIVSLDLNKPQYIPLNDAVLQIVFAEDGTGVDRVMVGGRDIVRDGRVIGIDLRQLRERASETQARLKAANEPLRQFFLRAEPHISAFYRSQVTGAANSLEG